MIDDLFALSREMIRILNRLPREANRVWSSPAETPGGTVQLTLKDGAHVGGTGEADLGRDGRELTVRRPKQLHRILNTHARNLMGDAVPCVLNKSVV